VTSIDAIAAEYVLYTRSHRLWWSRRRHRRSITRLTHLRTGC
jgi:hypothetical protein